MHDFFRLKIVSKRQVTIPQLMLEKLHLREGDEIEVEIDDANIVAVRPLKLVPADFFSDTILQQLEERSKSMDAGRKANANVNVTEPEISVVVEQVRPSVRVKGLSKVARETERERSAGGD
jgi:AbrB family looped-hinge helix DNA binding protein